ncbi:MAG: hypothetical protein A2042_07100 [Candidatus Schekmanbacteria bacterium GWA2_38_11]|uniref:Uncharacterized protein n=1 Tax=Candidatus Schekmanbacteria bacterium GWA2_38_11 TaxID=1817876 RepID=A0A1F7RP25_9BACT|nr:MAG: hypothetical protein A2042_07100 [Candidatus Schekmanbacteria bacterium GWA2_38_11]
MIQQTIFPFKIKTTKEVLTARTMYPVFTVMIKRDLSCLDFYTLRPCQGFLIKYKSNKINSIIYYI